MPITDLKENDKREEREDFEKEITLLDKTDYITMLEELEYRQIDYAAAERKASPYEQKNSAVRLKKSQEPYGRVLFSH